MENGSITPKALSWRHSAFLGTDNAPEAERLQNKAGREDDSDIKD